MLRSLQIFVILQHILAFYCLCHVGGLVVGAAAAEAATGQVQGSDQHDELAGSPTLAHAKLRLAEAKLLSSNSSLLDVQGGINLLLDVADVLQQHMSGAVSHHAQQQQQQSSRLQPGRQYSAKKQQQPPLQQSRSDTGSRSILSSSTVSNSWSANSPLKRLGASSARSADRAKRRRSRHSRASAVWTPLGRAGFMLAGLSASGLFAEFLPPAPFAARSSNDTAAAAAQQELSWLQTAALAGHVDAQLALADRYRFGRGGVEARCTRSLAWLIQAAKSLAVIAEQEHDIDPQEPVVLLRERWYDASYSSTVVDEQLLSRALEADAAIHGDSYSLRQLGYRQLVGRGMPADPAEAFHNFVAAADGGDGYALYNLGYMSLQGMHTARSPAKAITYFRRALERGVAASANALGVVYFHGWGVPPSMQLAKGWFEQGANMSNPESFYNLGTMYAEGLGVARDPIKALDYYNEAHDLGHWKAAYTIALLYMKDTAGGGVGYDCDTATQHLWQFVAERSPWTPGSNTALRLYDTRERAAATAVAQPNRRDGDEAAASTAAAAAAAADSTPAAAVADATGPNHAATAASAASQAEAPAAAAAAVPAPQLGPWWWPRWQGRFTQSLLQYLLLAESGCGDCGVNAAWMLMRGEGAGGARAVAAAADYLYRASLLNHTSSMILLSHLLAEAAGMQAASPPAAAAAMPLRAVPQLQEVFLSDPHAYLPLAGGPTLATGKGRSAPKILQKLQNCSQHLLANTHGKYPAAPTTLYRRTVQHELRKSQHEGKAGSTASGASSSSSSSDGGSSSGGSSSSSGSAPAASVVLCRAHRAAVAWLYESAQAGDTEAAANLAWLWQQGELLPADADKASQLMHRALQHSEYTLGHPALSAMHITMHLELVAQQLLGNRAATVLVKFIGRLHSSAVRLFGYGLDVVLALPDGLHVPLVSTEYNMPAELVELLQMFEQAGGVGVESANGESAYGSGSLAGTVHGEGDYETEAQRGHSSSRGSSSSSKGNSGKKRGGDGADGTKSGIPVDMENLILTVLLGILAGVLWLRRRIHQ